MKINIEFEKLKKTIILAAKLNGLTEVELSKNWDINYEVNQDKEFKYLVNDLNEEIKLLNQSIVNKDFLTTKSAMIMASIHARNLRDFLDCIYEDIERLGWGEELKDKWPSIPEDYKVPDHYDYENTNLTYEEQVARNRSS